MSRGEREVPRDIHYRNGRCSMHAQSIGHIIVQYPIINELEMTSLEENQRFEKCSNDKQELDREKKGEMRVAIEKINITNMKTRAPKVPTDSQE